MNGWGPSDDGFATREATIADGIEWAPSSETTPRTAGIRRVLC